MRSGSSPHVRDSVTALEELEAPRGVSRRHLCLSECLERARDPSRVTEPLSQIERLAQMRHCVLGPDVFYEEVEPDVAMDLGLGVEVDGITARLDELKCLPEVCDGGAPVVTKHLRDEPQAEQRQSGSGPVRHLAAERERTGPLPPGPHQSSRCRPPSAS